MAAVGLVAILGLLLPLGGHAHPAVAGPAATVAAAEDPRPNIVLVVMDDYSMDLLSTMRRVKEMRRAGAFYRHSYVVDSRCCPSRASLLTGQYPHQTGVLVNHRVSFPDTGPQGGFYAFEAHGNFQRSVNVQLQAAGYTTGFVGKYLNLYSGQVLPPGWSWWRALVGGAYDGWGFRTTRVVDGAVQLREHPVPPQSASNATKDLAYAGRVTSDFALRFLRSHRDDPAPYFLTVAPYATHPRDTAGAFRNDPLFPSAFRDRGPGKCGERPCANLDARDLPGFADSQKDNVPRYASGELAPQWRKGSAGPSATALTRDFRNRARMAQSIDRMLGRILGVVDDNTYVVLTSDNGFHLGQHRLGRGKGTPFASDTQVPLLVVGPGVMPGKRGEVVSNIDLAPTFEELAGLTPAPYRSGESLVPTFGDLTINRRDAAFLEHLAVRNEVTTGDPDVPYDTAINRIPSYTAVRTRDALLVRFDLDRTREGVDPAWEFYDYSRVRWEKTNEYGRPEHADRIEQLARMIDHFDACSEFVEDEDVPPECRSIPR
jgi:N-acetylglucosamine-6-sulfatase